MKNDISYILIETLIRKTLKEMQLYPKRNIRNLIDLALLLSTGNFQNKFFSSAQSFLKNENSLYYELTNKIVTNVDHERLTTFGMNVGYNSFTEGVKKIREKEYSLSCNIPWIVNISVDNNKLSAHEEDYNNLISEGEKLGIYSWIIFLDKISNSINSIIKNHPNSAFFIFLKDNYISKESYDYINNLNNLMLIINLDKNNFSLYKELDDKKLLYSVYYYYSEKNLSFILDGSIFEKAQRFNPFFTIFIPDCDCDKNSKEIIYKVLQNNFVNQSFSTIPWDLTYGNQYINGLISNNYFDLIIDKNGYIYKYSNNQLLKFNNNIFCSNLVSILKNCFKK